MEQKLFHEILDRIGVKWEIGADRTGWAKTERSPFRGYTVVLPEQCMIKCDWCGIDTHITRHYTSQDDGTWIGKCGLRDCRKNRKFPIKNLTKTGQ